MKLDEAGLKFICASEGFSAQEYLCEAGARTIGFGHLIRANEDFSAGISREAAEKLLLTDLESYEACVNYLTGGIALSQLQYNALVSLCYNIGSSAFSSSTLVRKLREGNFTEAADEFLRWKFVKGKISKGLYYRRVKEREMFLKGETTMSKFFSVTSISAVVGLLSVILGFCGIDLTAQEKTDLITNSTQAVSAISFLAIFVRNIVVKLKDKK